MAQQIKDARSYERREQIIREAQALRAQAIRAGVRALAARIAHPLTRHQHA
ncbi:MAG: hypothetical protein KDK10_13350 [Maritimibacter sp.]|nr:hypothetical protein [Maritimibacter sp.]